MNEEDFACDKFAPQKWRKDVCRNCFQPQRLHEKKQRKPTIKSAEKKGGSEATNANTSPKAEPKVFKRYRQQRDSGIDTSIPARERTQPQQLEGIQPGTIKKVLGVAPTLKVDSKKFQEAMQRANPGASPQPSSGPQADSASSQTDTDTASAQPDTDTASSQPDTDTASSQPNVSAASPQAVSLSTASSQPDTSATNPQAVIASSQPDSSAASPQTVSLSTAISQPDTSAASPQAVSISTASSQPDTSTASPQTVSISTASSQTDTSAASPQAVSHSMASPQPDTSTATPQAVSISTASSQAIPPEATPLSHSSDGEGQTVSGGQVESHEHEQQQPVSESCESSAPQQLRPSESAVKSENQDTSAGPIVTAGAAESSQLSQDHSITESFQDQGITESQDQSTGITESPHDPNVTESSEDQPQVDDANADSRQVQGEVRDDLMQGSDTFRSETASQEVELGITRELTEKDAQETAGQPNVEQAEEPEELVSEKGTKETSQPNVGLSEEPQELVSELNENAQEPAAGLAEVQGTIEQEEVLTGEGGKGEGGKEEEADEVVVSYSPLRDEDDQQSGGDGALDDHDAVQDVAFDEEPHSKLEVPTVHDTPATGNGVALTTEKQDQEDSLTPVVPKPTPEEGETLELATGTEDGERPKLNDEDAVVLASNNAATPDVVTKVASDGVPIPPLPPLPPGVPTPPPPPPLPPGVEVEQQLPYPRPMPNDIPNDDSIPTPPLPPGVPPPPPPPPLPSPAKVGNQRPKPAQDDRLPESVQAHQAAMQAIQGGVSLRAVPPPSERTVGQEKVVDVASELRQRVLKQRKQESQSITSRLSQHREEIQKMADLLHRYHGTASFLRHLRTLLTQIEDFLKRVEIPEEILAQKMEWPAQLVDNLREVLENMRTLEGKVEATEHLCKKTMENSVQVSGGVPVWKVNPADVEKCVWDVVRVAKDLNSDESRYFRASQSYPVDTSDIQGLLQRAADAVTPLLDKLYEKAFQSHQSVFDPTVTKYDLSFRLKNTQRLLTLCCKISDSLGMYLQVPKHPLYSEAQLKSRELMGEFQKAMQVIERQGEWDVEESFDLQKPFTKRASSGDVREDTQLVSRVLEAVTAGREVEEALGDVTEQLFFRIEVQLIKAAVASGNTQVIDCVMTLRNRCYAEEEDKHKRDFDWLLEAVNKGEQECVMHLVKNHSISINCQSGDAANSVLHRCVQRQNLPMLAFLIRQGGNPLLENTSRRTPLQLLALKCFPPHHYTARTEEEREPLFSLSSYINNPSLSDVVLVSEDGERFFAHRLVMCAQSPVFKTMLDSELWVESKNKEIPLPTINGRVVRTLLQYLYTGRCLFSRDDLNLGLDLMIAADQFLLEPMRLQCERALSDKIDAEVVIPLYHAAFRYSTTKLLANCTNFLLNHYKEVSDPDHEALLHLLENSQQK